MPAISDRRRIPALRVIAGLLVLGCVSPSVAYGQEAGFLVQIGSDTIAVERFASSPGRLTGELADRTSGMRFTYEATFGVDLHTASFVASIRRLVDDPTAEPFVHSVLEMVGDSVFATVENEGTPQDQRFATTAGAVPFINLSFALVQHAIRQALADGATRAAVPLLLVANGQTIDAEVTAYAPDSVHLSFAGVELIVAMDESGSFVRGSVPSQNVSITRVGPPSSAELSEAPPDYSAPPDAPYAAPEVVIETPAGITLAGTLTIPEGDGPWPAVVLITGSGSQDRDETIRMVRGYQPFRQIADTLSRRGIAVLRVDDRGIGGSDPGPSNPTSADFAADVRAEVAYLRSRADIDGARIGLAGHSEGGIIAPMVAASDPTIAGIALLAGTSQNGREILEYQNHQLIYGNEAVDEASRDSLYAAALVRLDSIAATEGWLPFFMTYEPLLTAREVTGSPVLILQGETDRQVTADQAPELERAFGEAGNPDVTMIVYPDMNHLFLVDPDGAVSGYAELSEREIPDFVLGDLADWFSVRLR